MDDYDPQITWLARFFYPSSESTLPDPVSTAASISAYLQTDPLATASFATHLPAFLLHTAKTHPAHTDHVLYATKLLRDNRSLPLINNWGISRSNATFAEMFFVGFSDDLEDEFRGVELAERYDYIAASLLSGRTFSMGILSSPRILWNLAEGLGFQDSEESMHHYQPDEARIAAIGSCLQLLGSAATLVREHPMWFSKDKILAALDCLPSNQNDALIKLTKSHMQKKPLVDLTSEEIVDSLKRVDLSIPGLGDTD